MSIPDSGRLAFLNATKPYALKGTLLLLSSMALAGPVICLSVAAAPLVLLFSPVLVVAFLSTAAAVFAGLTIFAGLGVSAYWMYNYTAGKKPLRAERVCFCLIWRVRKAIKVLVATPPRKEVAAANVVT